MRVAAPIVLTPEERTTLERWARGGRTAARLALRAQIVLRAAAGRRNDEIVRELDTDRECVGRWRARLARQRLAEVARDAPRPGRTAAIAPAALRLTDRDTLPALDLHLIVDNYATRKHPAVQHWRARHPRFHLHLIPTSSSWLNLVERWFRELIPLRPRRGVFKSMAELIAAIEAFIAHHNRQPQLFASAAKLEDILAKGERGRTVLHNKMAAV